MIPDPTESDLKRDAEADYQPSNVDYSDFSTESRRRWIRRAVHAEKRAEAAERQLAEFGSLMAVPCPPEGEERPAKPEDLRKYIDELQREWDDAERRAFATEAKLAFLKSKGLTVGMLKEAGKEPRLSYHIEPGSELCDLELLSKLSDAERRADALAVRLATIAKLLPVETIEEIDGGSVYPHKAELIAAPHGEKP